ncbi:uroporphyrinogen-III synthase [Staphylococcus sp. IVB6246]|uniref:uroporphyrinogen-III synthase n=1 Tax=unclassified Staphylococcus TaxID=91994 RepID=UPI0021D199E6|nr:MULTISPECIES: uroporphyrinogen-III synthase [unclassified Staphylococcus]UXR70492.1 uroporphyrinogen-III synthase [Staphylococcus sp. IVB6246]UXR72557.1 uroporphyrinogen-III synthase [Staphylococcus sp. IVB6240]UXR74862.1 uroporphyrinogen-III synthase [Staphylococcus sp. IVB6238]
MKPTVLMTQTNAYDDHRIEVCHIPLVDTVLCAFDKQLLEESFDWLIFSSKNAVEYFIPYLSQTRVAKIAAIGEKTKAYCALKGIHVDFVPDDFSQDGLLAQFDAQQEAKILLPSSARARPKLTEELSRRYGKVTKIDLYDVVVNKSAVQEVYDMLLSHQVDAITFASSSAVRALFDSYPHIPFNSWYVIGQQTHHTLSQYGYEGVVAETQTLEAMIDKILEKGF